MVKAGDYIFATVSLGQRSWAVAYFWRILKVTTSQDTERLTNVWLEDVHGTGKLDDWPLSFIDIHEVVNKEAAEILYGRPKG